MLWLVPSRGRPQNAQRLITAFRATRLDNSTELMFCLDDDDDTVGEYEDLILAESEDDGWIGYSIAPRMRVGPTLNYYATRYAATRSYVGFMGDDHVPQTPGFDTELLRTLAPQNVAVVYGNDLFQGPNLPTAVMMTANIIRTLGYMNPPGLTHLFLDNFWRTIGERTNTLTYRPDVIIEHMHPQANKSEWDDLYVDVNGGDMWARDKAAWDTYVAEELSAAIDQIERLKQVA